MLSPRPSTPLCNLLEYYSCTLQCFKKKNAEVKSKDIAAVFQKHFLRDLTKLVGLLGAIGGAFLSGPLMVEKSLTW
jgi:hypothetical protein